MVAWIWWLSRIFHCSRTFLFWTVLFTVHLLAGTWELSFLVWSDFLCQGIWPVYQYLGKFLECPLLAPLLCLWVRWLFFLQAAFPTGPLWLGYPGWNDQCAHLLLTSLLLCLFTRGEWVSQQELFALSNFRLTDLLPGLTFIIVLYNPDLAKKPVMSV